jgi:hypothetical protein
MYAENLYDDCNLYGGDFNLATNGMVANMACCTCGGGVMAPAPTPAPTPEPTPAPTPVPRVFQLEQAGQHMQGTDGYEWYARYWVGLSASGNVLVYDYYVSSDRYFAVMSFNGTSWVSLDNKQFKDTSIGGTLVAEVNWRPSISGDGTVIAPYDSSPNMMFLAFKWNGTSWNSRGYPPGIPTTQQPSQYDRININVFSYNGNVWAKIRRLSSSSVTQFYLLVFDGQKYNIVINQNLPDWTDGVQLSADGRTLVYQVWAEDPNNYDAQGRLNVVAAAKIFSWDGSQLALEGTVGQPQTDCWVVSLSADGNTIACGRPTISASAGRVQVSVRAFVKCLGAPSITL